ncbi:MAG: glycosyltransferase [Sphingobacteriales bacterium]|nr:glycosyltransferase [Sphingobacteriales bacterium]
MADHYPTISLIIPSFNQGKYLEATLQSVWQQQYPNLECIVVDGGSTDETISILQRYARYFKHLIIEKDGGQSEAINKGLRLASGDLVNWLNSDDLLYEGALMRVAQWYNTSQRHEILCYGGTVEFGDHIRNRLRFGHTQGLPHRYFAGSCFPQPTAFFKREALATLGGLDEDLHFTMDFDWYVRLFLQYDFAPLKHLLSWTRFHPEAKTVGRFNEYASRPQPHFSQLLHSLPHTKLYTTTAAFSVVSVARKYLHRLQNIQP